MKPFHERLKNFNNNSHNFIYNEASEDNSIDILTKLFHKHDRNLSESKEKKYRDNYNSLNNYQLKIINNNRNSNNKLSSNRRYELNNTVIDRYSIRNKNENSYDKNYKITMYNNYKDTLSYKIDYKQVNYYLYMKQISCLLLVFSIIHTIIDYKNYKNYKYIYYNELFKNNKFYYLNKKFLLYIPLNVIFYVYYSFNYSFYYNELIEKIIKDNYSN